MTLLRAITTVGGYTLISRVLGFVRDVLLAAILGAGAAADAFVVAFKLPNLFRRLFAEGAFNAAFVPLFARRLAGEGRDAARLFAEQAQAVLFFVLMAFILIAEAAMPWAMRIVVPGFAVDPEKLQLAIELTRITFPYLLFVSLVSLIGGVLNSLERFAATSATPILLNLVMIAGLVFWQWYAPSAAHGAAWGVVAAGLAQLIWLAMVLRSAGLGLRLRLPRLSPEVKRLLILMLPVALGAGVYQINVVVDVVIASFLPTGSVSFLYYADRLNQLPLGVVGIAIGTALLPILARQIRAGEDQAALANQNRALEVALALTLPAAAALIVIAQPIIAVLFERGAFGAEAVSATALALAAYAIGLPAHVLAKVFTPGYFAREDTATPVKIAVAIMIINAALAVALMLVLQGYGMGHVGIALATSLTGWLNAGLLWRGLARRGQFSLDARLRRRAGPILLAAVAMAGVLAMGQGLFAPWLAGPLFERVVALTMLIAAGALVYGLIAQLLGAIDLRELKGMLRPRRAQPPADTPND